MIANDPAKEEGNHCRNSRSEYVGTPGAVVRNHLRSAAALISPRLSLKRWTGIVQGRGKGEKKAGGHERLTHCEFLGKEEPRIISVTHSETMGRAHMISPAGGTAPTWPGAGRRRKKGGGTRLRMQ